MKKHKYGIRILTAKSAEKNANNTKKIYGQKDGLLKLKCFATWRLCVKTVSSCMAHIALTIKEFELGVKVSEKLIAAGNEVEFLENPDQLNQGTDVLVISTKASYDLQNLRDEFYIIGYADVLTKDELSDWKSRGFNRVILRSTLIKNLPAIVEQILAEGK